MAPETFSPETPEPGPALPELERRTAGDRRSLLDLPRLFDLELRVEVPLGRIDLTIERLLELDVGSIVQLDRLTGESLEITANGIPVATGEVRVHGERFAVRVTKVLQAVLPDENEKETAE